MTDQVSHLHKTTGKITVLYIWNFIFLDSNLEDERFCTKWQHAFLNVIQDSQASNALYWSRIVVSAVEWYRAQNMTPENKCPWHGNAICHSKQTLSNDISKKDQSNCPSWPHRCASCVFPCLWRHYKSQLLLKYLWEVTAGHSSQKAWPAVQGTIILCDTIKSHTTNWTCNMFQHCNWEGRLRTTLPNPDLKQLATDTNVKQAGTSWLLTLTLISSALE